MKKLFGFIFALLLLYVIYIDLTVGTLPNTSAERASVELETAAVVNPKSILPSFKEKVEPGETVISIVEAHLEKQIPVSITELVQDFRELNPGQSPEKIQIGATYLFPDYSKK